MNPGQVSLDSVALECGTLNSPMIVLQLSASCLPFTVVSHCSLLLCACLQQLPLTPKNCLDTNYQAYCNQIESKSSERWQNYSLEHQMHKSLQCQDFAFLLWRFKGMLLFYLFLNLISWFFQPLLFPHLLPHLAESGQLNGNNESEIVQGQGLATEGNLHILVSSFLFKCI